MSSEVTLRERTAGARFQIALEYNRASFIREVHHDLELPRFAISGVRTTTCIVRR
jgi:hypothetical protein